VGEEVQLCSLRGIIFEEVLDVLALLLSDAGGPFDSLGEGTLEADREEGWAIA